MRKSTLFFVLAFIPFLMGQDDAENKTGFLSNKTMDDSRAIQYYYQKFQSTQSADRGEAEGWIDTGVSPSFGMDKETLLEEMRKATPLDGSVDPEIYRLGPNDLLSINIWGRIPFEYKLAVTPEGTLVVPNVGILDVGGKTLNEAKRLISEQMGKTFIQGEITATLLKARIFLVHVGGVVDNPGTYYASASQRVDHAIYQANLRRGTTAEKEGSLQAKRQQELTQTYGIRYFGVDDPIRRELVPSLRNIRVIRRNGDTLDVDLVSYYATGDTRWNPYLNDGDRIVVPNLNLAGNSVSISGEVRLEGTYEFFPGDSLKHLLNLAQGATHSADMEGVELYRKNSTSGGYDRILVNMKNVLAGKEHDIPLAREDKIVVPPVLPKKREECVTLKGEVRRPGIYPILNDRTSLRELILAAGGFTEEASLREARVLRNEESEDRAAENPDYSRLSMLRLSPLDQQEREYFNFESAIMRSFVSVDFEKVFSSGDTTRDVRLRGGDVVWVPRRKNAVYVFGQVKNPGYVEFIPGQKHRYYVSRAGGPTRMANQNGVKIIQAGNLNWFFPGQVDVQAGDSIYIPRKKDRTFIENLSRLSTVLSLASSILTVVFVLSQN
ncbi:MAG: SLBB domain-containing protein [bacterium]|nr:SLBB domain-containing protein [bacterium]